METSYSRLLGKKVREEIFFRMFVYFKAVSANSDCSPQTSVSLTSPKLVEYARNVGGGRRSYLRSTRSSLMVRKGVSPLR